ncbi:DUF1674 domain-containing protein [Streptomyces sclerotialus]|uniref:DUF1674 domain-containing protein n=1 Tax=Streptomyces sclerotialus TaxID=1957 RepID=UPI000ABBBA92
MGEAGTGRGRQGERREEEPAPAQRREPAEDERDRSAEEVNADQPSERGEKPGPAPKRY